VDELRHVIMHEIKITGHEGSYERNKAEKENPFLLLGYGILSYFTFLQQLIILLLIITLFCTPIFYIYCNGLGRVNNSGFDIMKTTMGNLGGADSMCESKPMPVSVV